MGSELAATGRSMLRVITDAEFIASILTPLRLRLLHRVPRPPPMILRWGRMAKWHGPPQSKGPFMVSTVTVQSTRLPAIYPQSTLLYSAETTRNSMWRRCANTAIYGKSTLLELWRREKFGPIWPVRMHSISDATA